LAHLLTNYSNVHSSVSHCYSSLAVSASTHFLQQCTQFSQSLLLIFGCRCIYSHSTTAYTAQSVAATRLWLSMYLLTFYSNAHSLVSHCYSSSAIGTSTYMLQQMHTAQSVTTTCLWLSVHLLTTYSGVHSSVSRCCSSSAVGASTHNLQQRTQLSQSLPLIFDFQAALFQHTVKHSGPNSWRISSRCGNSFRKDILEL
jgi:hypothetical protein